MKRKKVQTKKGKYIVYFSIEKKFKHLQYSKFHTEADSTEEAIKNLAEKAWFKHRVIGVGDAESPEFVNNKFE